MLRVTSSVLAACALTAAIIPSAATADTFVPIGTYEFTGTVQVSSPFWITCTMHMTIAATGGDAEVVSASLSGGLCGTTNLKNFPWNINVTAPAGPPWASATEIEFVGMDLTGVLMNCGPDSSIKATWTPGSPPVITFPNGTQINPPVAGCGLEGSLSQTSGGSSLVIVK